MDSEVGSGGGDDGPTHVNVRQFVAARVSEIASLTTLIANAHDPKVTKGFSFQHVAKHMRRRAVSHHPKRLPTRLRADHIHHVNKCSGGSVKKTKKESRFHRKRRDGNILEYNYRQLRSPNKPRWLESHVWHAKRFHMTPLWGMMIPKAPTAKCFRSLYKASNQTAIMQDVSFLRCLMIKGNSRDNVLSGISRLITADYNLGGIRGGELSTGRELLGVVTSTLTGDDDKNTSRYLGSIRYQLVIPKVEGEKFKLIIWYHPVFQQEMIDELCLVYDLEEHENSKLKPEEMEHELNQDEQKFLWKLVNCQEWWNKKTDVGMKDMSEFYNRIRVTGPKTLATLKQIFEIGNHPNYGDPQSKIDQEQIWNSVETICSVPDNMTLVLDVVDPRLKLPKIRKGVDVNVSGSKGSNSHDFFSTSTSSMGSGSLWSEEAVRRMLRTKMPDKEVSEKRRQNLIPGTSITEDMTPNVVSIGLVFHSNYDIGNVGIDIIVPVGWMMPVWIALSFCAVRAYGLEFDKYLSFEMKSFNGLNSSTHLPPDAIPFESFNSSLHSTKKSKYYSYSPAKRANYIKLACVFPFSVDWQRFLKFSLNLDEEAQAIDVKVMRKLEDLVALSNYLFSKQCKNDKILEFELNLDDTQLVPVKLYLFNGCVSEGSCICLPTNEDYDDVLKNGGLKPTEKLQQDAQEDTNEKSRRALRESHHKKLAVLAKKRKSVRRAQKVAGESEQESFECRLKELDSNDIVEAFNKKMNQLWLNDDEDVEQVLAKQTRQVMGFVTYSHFSYKSGTFAGFGYVTLRQMKNLIMLVLVRDWSQTLEYRWARMSVCLPSCR